MKRKIVAIVAADVVGYSRLVSIEEEETVSRLMMYRHHFTSVVEFYGGRVFNTAGDAILAEFVSSEDALRASTEVLEAIRNYNKAYTPSQRIMFRVGMTVGDVIEQDGDLFGDAVNVAARLEGLAEPGGICLSAAFHDQVVKNVSVRFIDLGYKPLKNISEPVRVFAIHFLDDSDLEDLRAVSDVDRRKASIVAVTVVMIAFLVVIGGFAVIFARQKLDVSFFTGEFASEKVPKAAQDRARDTPVRTPSRLADQAISDVSLRPKIDVQGLCGAFSVSAQRALEVNAVGQAGTYMEKLQFGKAGFSVTLDPHEAATSMGFNQGFASIYGELKVIMLHDNSIYPIEQIKSALSGIIDQRRELIKLYDVDRYRLVIAYYWALSEGSCAFPSTQGTIPPTPNEMENLIASRDITVSYPKSSYDVFGVLYQDADRFQAVEAKGKGFWTIYELMNEWRSFIIADAKGRRRL